MSKKTTKKPLAEKTRDRNEKTFVIVMIAVILVFLLAIAAVAIVTLVNNREDPEDIGSTTASTNTGGEEEDLPVIWDATDTYRYQKLSDTTARLVSYEGEETESIVVPKTIDGLTVVEIDGPAYTMLTLSPKSIWLPKSVTLIAANAFLYVNSTEIILTYEGSVEEYKQIIVGENSEWLEDVTTDIVYENK